jgi:hypothetical protein
MIKINFIPTTSRLLYLNRNEWLDMINIFIDRLNETIITKIIKEKLEDFITQGYTVTISNIDSTNIIIYPKCKYINKKSVLIIIPNVPYFISTELIDPIFFDYLPKKNKPDTNNYKQHTCYEKVPGFISFVHELIHCLRFFEEKDDINEEEDVIYGLHNVLSYNINDNLYYITENQVRQELGYKPRINHNSKELLCEGINYTSNKISLFTKKDFY